MDVSAIKRERKCMLRVVRTASEVETGSNWHGKRPPAIGGQHTRGLIWLESLTMFVAAKNEVKRPFALFITAHANLQTVTKCVQMQMTLKYRGLRVYVMMRSSAVVRVQNRRWGTLHSGLGP